MNQAIQQVLDAVKAAAPVVWKAAYRQAYVDGTYCALLTVVLAITAVCLLRMARRAAVREARGYQHTCLECSKPIQDNYRPLDYDNPVSVVRIVFAVICSIPAPILAYYAISALVNPTYAAIGKIVALRP